MMEVLKVLVYPVSLLIILFILLILRGLLTQILATSDVELPWLKIRRKEPSRPMLEKSATKKEEIKPKTEEEKVKEEKVETLILQFIATLKEDKTEESEKIFEKILEKSTNEAERCYHECRKYYAYHLLKKRNVLPDLDDVSRRYPDCHYPHSYKGYIYSDLKEYRKAISCFGRARDISKDTNVKLDIEVRISKIKRLDFDYEGLEHKLNSLLNQYEEDKQKSYIYEELGHLYLVRDKNKEKAISYFEKVLELNPDNIDIRFNIAYQYSELGKNEEAFFYYKTYCDNKDDAMGLNNLGVACHALGMLIKAVHYYNEAIEKKESLAMANLANKYIDEGFIEKARKLLEEGLKCDKPHPNVAKAISRIQSLEEKENNKEKEVLESVIRSKSKRHFK